MNSQCQNVKVKREFNPQEGDMISVFMRGDDDKLLCHLRFTPSSAMSLAEALVTVVEGIHAEGRN